MQRQALARLADQRMKHLQHAMDRAGLARPGADKSKPETADAQPERPEEQEEDLPPHVRPGRESPPQGKPGQGTPASRVGIRSVCEHERR